jgi:hypothetical protein
LPLFRNDVTMSLAGFALKRPYTIIASIMLVCMLAFGALQRMATEIVSCYERQLASLDDGIGCMEAIGYAAISDAFAQG